MTEYPQVRPARRWGTRAVLAAMFAGVVFGGVTFTAEPAHAIPVIDFPVNGGAYAGSDIVATGTSDQDATVEVYVDANYGSPTCIIPSGGVGTWNWNCAITGLTGDQHLIEVGFGGLSPDPPQIFFEMEGVPLIIDFPASGGTVYGTPTPTVRGTADANGQDVRVYLDGDLVTPWCTATAPANVGGTWSCTGGPAIPEGFHFFTAQQTTLATTFPPEKEYIATNVNVDYSMPEAVVDTDPDGVIRIPSAGTLSMSGTGVYYPEDPSTIDIRLYDEFDTWVSACQVAVSSDGTWTCNAFSVPQPDGVYEARVDQVTASQLPVIPVEPYPLEIGGPAVTYPLEGDIVPGNDFTITGTSGSAAQIEVYLNLQPTPFCTFPAGGDWQCDVTGLSGGGQTIRVEQTPFTDFNVSYTLQGAPLTVDFPLEGQTVYGLLDEVTGTADSGNSIFVDMGESAWCAVGPPAVGGGTWSCFGTDPGVGEHTVTASSGGDSVSHTFTIAANLPAATITTGAGGIIHRTTGNTVTLAGSGTYYSYMPVQVTARLYTTSNPPPAESVLSCTTTPATDGSWSCSLGTALPADTYFARVDQYLEVAGTTVSSLYTLAVTAPVVPPAPDLVVDWTLTVVDDSGNDLVGTVLHPGQQVFLGGVGLPAGATISAELHSTPVPLGVATVGPDGSFLLPATIPGTMEVGEHEFVALMSAPGYSAAERRVPTSIQPVPAEPIAEVDEEEPAPTPAPEVQPSTGFTSTLATPNAFSEQLRTLAQLDLGNPVVLATIAATGGGILFFVVFPSLIAESAIHENYHRIFGRLAPLRRRLAELRAKLPVPRVKKWLKSLLLMAAAALMTVFVDPGAGLDAGTLRLFLGMFMATYVVNYVVTAMVGAAGFRWYRALPHIEVSAGGLLLVLGSVVFSRLVGVEPGVLFAALIGLQFGRALRLAQEAKLALLGTGLSLALGISAWVGYSAISAGSGEPTFWSLLWQETLAAITVESIVALVVLMLPLAFLDGKVLWNWSKLAWLGAYAVVLSVFAIVVLPMPENWADFIAPTTTTLVVIGGFTLACIALWAWFQFRPAPEVAEEPVSMPESESALR